MAAPRRDAATVKVVLGGLAHAEDLGRISRLAGEVDEPTRTRSSGTAGASISVGPRRLPALPVEFLRTLPPGQAIVLARQRPPVHVRLTPWWSGPRAAEIDRALGVAADPRRGLWRGLRWPRRVRQAAR